MYKAGGILAAVAAVLVTGLGAGVSPLCGPCLALFIGLGAGYLAGVFDKPAQTAAARAGAIAGAVAGAGALVGHLLAAVINSFLVGPEGATALLRQLGVNTPVSPASFYGGQFGGGCCFGLLDIGLMAGLGALGAILWYNLSGKNQAAQSGGPLTPA